MIFTWEPETSGLTGVQKNLGDADSVRTLVSGPELAFHMLLPNPDGSSGATLEGLSGESATINGKGLGNWWYK